MKAVIAVNWGFSTCYSLHVWVVGGSQALVDSFSNIFSTKFWEALSLPKVNESQKQFKNSL